NRPYHPPCSTALVSDEHEPRDSVNSPTAFALNSGVHPAPFAMAPSSPIEPGEIRNKKQFISHHLGARLSSPAAVPQISCWNIGSLASGGITFGLAKLSLARAQDKNLVTMYHSKEVEA
ncbi:hypothetical protein ABKP88_08915, partial [Bifidobacterium bifidum]|uniref:hypothetical protein n=1 Tax=Bifidobacterium bifidum TaxID=1681 RepID=UPI0032DF5796